jgi:hypothetical protein
MKIFKVGDSKSAICEHCGSVQSATFRLRDVALSDGSGVVKKVLVGVCDECDQVCLLPHQSTPAVKKQLEAQRKAVEIRLPAHMLDIISLAAFELGGSSDFVPNLMKYYIHKLAHDPEVASILPALLDSELTAGKAEKRLSLKGRQITDDIDRLKAATGIANTTDLIKSVILLINKDVLTEKQPRSIQNLKDVFAAVA